jgi:hypothetical protein
VEVNGARIFGAEQPIKLREKLYPLPEYTAISIKVVPEQSGKVESTSAKACWLGIAKKLIIFLAIPSKPFALVFGDNLN